VLQEALGSELSISETFCSETDISGSKIEVSGGGIESEIFMWSMFWFGCC